MRRWALGVIKKTASEARLMCSPETKLSPARVKLLQNGLCVRLVNRT